MHRDSTERPMPTLLRLVQILRKGPRARRLQAWGGLGLVGGAALWLFIVYLWPILIIIAVALAGLFLLRRSLRDSSHSS